jgi:hypothetical protein
MNCTSCGANLPQNTAQCPLCGTPTPYNVSPPQYDPTMPASQPGSGSSPQYDPTMFAQPYGGTPPPASTEYGTPPPPPNPYNVPPATPNQYGAPPPPQQNIYGTPSQAGYGAQGGYVAPPQQPGYVPQPPPKRRSRLGLILGIIAVVLIVACAGISFAVYQGIKQTGNTIISSLDATTTSIAATATSVSNPTATTSTNTTPTTSTGSAPSGLSIDSAAATIITNVQMAAGVDSNFKPTTLTSTFATNKPVYATFTIPTNAPPNGFVVTKWYSDGKLDVTSKILTVQSDFVGYFSETYTNAAQGAVEFYWCTQSDCSDAKLADVANFTVTASGIHGTPPLALTFFSMDFNRP